MVMVQSAERSVLVVGSINLDMALESLRMPYEGESLIGSRYSYIPGGKGANQAVALTRHGADVTLVGKVGKDANGAKLTEGLRQKGVSTAFIAESEEGQTGLAVIFIGANAQNSILVFPGANMDIEKTDLRRAFEARSYDALMLQLEISREIVVEACHLAKDAGIPIILDAGPAQEFPLEMVRGIDVLTPNETEALALTGIEVKTVADADRAAEKLLTRSQAKAVVMKLGAAGALLRSANGDREHFAAPRVAAIDPTAAGDAFTAAMTIRYLETGDLREAIAYANFAGAFATTKLGAQSALPTAQEIEEFHAGLQLTERSDV
jgi:ribokinase